MGQYNNKRFYNALKEIRILFKYKNGVQTQEYCPDRDEEQILISRLINKRFVS